jgi:hypothetical protein
MTDMQRSLRTLNAEARDLRVTTAALRDRDREQHSASQALGRRVRALLLEAARRGYVPAFAALAGGRVLVGRRAGYRPVGLAP